LDTTDAVDTTELEGWFLNVGAADFKGTREDYGFASSGLSEISEETETEDGLTVKEEPDSNASTPGSSTEV
jgi:hypothetical protein